MKCIARQSCAIAFLIVLLFEGRNNQRINSNEDNALQKMFTNVVQNIHPLEVRLNHTFHAFVDSLSLSSPCRSAVLRWTRALKAGHFWAIQMLDAFEGIPTGLTNGLITSFGEYDLCLNVKSDSTDASEESQVVYGKYCLLRPYIDVSHGITFDQIDWFSLLNNETQTQLKQLAITNWNKLKTVMAMAGMTKKFHLFHLGVCVPSQCTVSDIDKVYYKGIL